MDLPKISIVTPNYNYGHFIGQTIDSVLGQDYENIEHIVVDDGSTDNSVEIISRYADKYPGKLKFVRQKNSGQTSAINTGLVQAQGEFVGWINSDDLYCAGTIKQIVDEFIKNEDIDIIYGDLSVIDQNGNKIKVIKQLPIDKTVGSLFGFGKLVASNTIFWRSSLMAKIGFLNEEFTCNMDGEYFSRLFFAGKAKHIKLCIASFRVHPMANSSNTNPEKMKRYHYEQDFELRRSYSNLLISKYIPYERSSSIKVLYRMKRAFLRLINGHYF
jgi:glycosyltransferase involved in cell wall biosynthesis